MDNKMTNFEFINEYCERVQRVRGTSMYTYYWMVDTGCAGGQFTSHYLEDALGRAAAFLDIEIIGE